MSEEGEVKAPEYDPLMGTKIMLIGDAGSGKTHAIGTLIEAGIRPMVIATDSGWETLGKFPRDKYSVRYVPPLVQDWGSLRQIFTIVNQMNYEAVTKSRDPQIGKYDTLLRLVDLCANFKDNEGRVWGPVDEWGTDRALVFDGLTGLNKICAANVVGGKPVKSQPEWQMAMDHEIKLIDMWNSLRCHFILLGHLEREKNEITGGETIMASALGRKNAPQFPPGFSDVVMSIREGGKFTWRTDFDGALLKTRNLAFTGALLPSFVPLIDAWKKKGGLIEPTNPQYFPQ